MFGEDIHLISSEIEKLQEGKQPTPKGIDMHTTVVYICQLADVWRDSFYSAFTAWRIKRSATFWKYQEIRDRETGRLLRDATACFEKILSCSGDGEDYETCIMDNVLRRIMLAAQKAGKPMPDVTRDPKIRDELMFFIYVVGHIPRRTPLGIYYARAHTHTDQENV
ncbi:hypothetical protein F4775DRAFT_244374 [Biscogniauxia sp. FL1348]|nr:hypothetical protein F4775DRAFT_244374 [Biscogniauxia sp. FL1348]